jgi:hypothetical protein
MLFLFAPLHLEWSNKKCVLKKLNEGIDIVLRLIFFYTTVAYLQQPVHTKKLQIECNKKINCMQRFLRQPGHP